MTDGTSITFPASASSASLSWDLPPKQLPLGFQICVWGEPKLRQRSWTESVTSFKIWGPEEVPSFPLSFPLLPFLPAFLPPSLPSLPRPPPPSFPSVFPSLHRPSSLAFLPLLLPIPLLRSLFFFLPSFYKKNIEGDCRIKAEYKSGTPNICAALTPSCNRKIPELLREDSDSLSPKYSHKPQVATEHLKYD